MLCLCCVGVQVAVKEGLKGIQVATAVQDYIRNNDVAIMEGCDKVS